jgi:hypothetical protein
MSLQAGAATRVINCEIGDDLCGQLNRRYALTIHDDLEANFLYLTDGRCHVMLINLDLIGLCETGDVPLLREAAAAASGLQPRDVVISHTHTHDGPDLFGLAPGAPRNEAYLHRLKGWLADGAAEAVRAARPARVGWAAGHAHVGFNRRLCWADGTHSMYGACGRAEFAGLEGPDDPQHSVLAAYDAEGKLVAVVHNNCCHATCVEAENFASADFPGEARARLRDILNTKLPVLYLQGASGDTSPWNMTRPDAFYDRHLRLREIGAALAAETARLLHPIHPTDDAPIANAWTDLPVGIRLPDEKTLAWALEVEKPGHKADWGDALRIGVLTLHRRFKDNPVDVAPLHAIRVGDLAIATNPCEFYCQFGLDIKRRSRAAVTMISQLTDGFAGYCPTLYAVMGGGYSGDPTYWCRMEPHAGYRIVEATGKLLQSLWA